jgi:hypothetical protein
MTLLHDATEFKKLDVRMVERNLARGVVSQDEVEKSAKKLPDDAENADYTIVDDLIED